MPYAGRGELVTARYAFAIDANHAFREDAKASDMQVRMRHIGELNRPNCITIVLETFPVISLPFERGWLYSAPIPRFDGIEP